MSRGCHCRVLPALFVAIAFLSLPAAFAQSGSEMQRLGWVNGPQEAKIGGQAKIDLPSDFAFLDANGTKRFLELTENIPSNEERGLLAPTDLSWFTIFSFEWRSVPPTTTNMRERLPERPHATVARAGPAGAASARLHFHSARPELACNAPSPFCREPSTYFTVSKQRALDGFTSTDTAAG